MIYLTEPCPIELFHIFILFVLTWAELILLFWFIERTVSCRPEFLHFSPFKLLFHSDFLLVMTWSWNFLVIFYTEKLVFTGC